MEKIPIRIVKEKKKVISGKQVNTDDSQEVLLI